MKNVCDCLENILHICRKGEKLNTWEEFEMYKQIYKEFYAK